MRWEDFPQSDNVEDYRGECGGGGGGGFGLPGGAGGLGIGTVLVLGLVGWASGIDPRLLISGVEILQGGGPSDQHAAAHAPAQTRRGRDGPLHRGVLGGTEDRWKEIFEKAGKRYTEPKLVVFPGASAPTPAARRSRDGSVLLSERSEDLSRHHVLPRPRSALPRLRRGQPRLPVRAGLCDRTRGRPPRPKPARRSAEGAAAAARHGQGRGQCAAGPGGAAGRLLRRPVGLSSDQKWRTIDQSDVDAALRTAAAIGDDRLQKQARARGAGELHPRDLGAAQALVHDRVQERLGRGLQHVQGRRESALM